MLLHHWDVSNTQSCCEGGRVWSCVLWWLNLVLLGDSGPPLAGAADLLLLSSKGHLAPLPSQLLMGQDCDCPAQCPTVPFDQWLLEIARHAKKVTDSEELCAHWRPLFSWSSSSWRDVANHQLCWENVTSLKHGPCCSEVWYCPILRVVGLSFEKRNCKDTKRRQKSRVKGWRGMRDWYGSRGWWWDFPPIINWDTCHLLKYYPCWSIFWPLDLTMWLFPLQEIC